MGVDVAHPGLHSNNHVSPGVHSFTMEYVHRRNVPIYRLLLAFGIGLVSPCPLEDIIFSSMYLVS